MKKNKQMHFNKQMIVTLLIGFLGIPASVFLNTLLNGIITIDDLRLMLRDWVPFIWTLISVVFVFYIVHLKRIDVRHYLNGNGDVISAQKAIRFLPRFVIFSISVWAMGASALGARQLGKEQFVFFQLVTLAVTVYYGLIIFLKTSIDTESHAKTIPLSDKYTPLNLNVRLSITALALGVSFTLGIIASDIACFFYKDNYKDLIFVYVLSAPFYCVTLTYIVFLLTRSITAPIVKLSKAMDRISKGEGDLTSRLRISSRDEIGVLVDRFNLFMDKLADMIAEIQKSGDILKHSFTEIEQASFAESEALSEQSDSVNEMSAAIQQMAASFEAITNNIALVAESSQQAIETVTQAHDVVKKSTVGMEGIYSSSRKTAGKILKLGGNSEAIGEIIDIINDVTRQTHLLALNASIEAIKAGEQGKGFALVAEQIRLLAEDVTESTKEIKEIVQDIQNATKSAVIAIEDETKKIEAGASLVSRTKDMFNNIDDVSQNTAIITEDIARTITEQNKGAQEISKVVLDVSKRISENAKEHEKIAGSLSRLSTISKNLEQSIDRFKVELKPDG